MLEVASLANKCEQRGQAGSRSTAKSQIRDIVDERATYGYRRVTALLKRKGTRANHKRVYRVMKQAELLLQRCTGNRPGRLHEGRVATLLPNLRWCTDTFVIRAWDGRRIEAAFSAT